MRYNRSYTRNMKTAVSLPDDLFRMAEASAKRLGVSRSEFYAKAIADFLTKNQATSITERLNSVYSQHSSKMDSALHRAQMKSLGKGGW